MENPTNGAEQEQIKPETQVPEQSPAQNEQAEIDYKAEYEKAQERLKKAEFTLYKKNMEEKQKKSEGAPVAPPNEDIEAKLEEAMNKRLTQLATDFKADAIETALESISSDPDEQKLIRFHYDNSIQRTGFSKTQIFEDMQKAKLLANAPKYLKQNQEMSEALKSKRATSTTSMGTNVDVSSVAPQQDDLRNKFSARDWDFMKSRGWSDEMIRKAANLNAANGAFMERPIKNV